jgi:hypothetical protein
VRIAIVLDRFNCQWAALTRKRETHLCSQCEAYGADHFYESLHIRKPGLDLCDLEFAAEVEGVLAGSRRPIA